MRALDLGFFFFFLFSVFFCGSFGEEAELVEVIVGRGLGRKSAAERRLSKRMEEASVVSSWPAPPAYYKLYGREGGPPPPPPPPPIQGTYTMFGDTYTVTTTKYEKRKQFFSRQPSLTPLQTEDKLPTLEESGRKQIYETGPTTS